MRKYGQLFPQADSINKRRVRARALLFFVSRNEFPEAGPDSQYGITRKCRPRKCLDVWEMGLLHSLESFSIATVPLAVRNDD